MILFEVSNLLHQILHVAVKTSMVSRLFCRPIKTVNKWVKMWKVQSNSCLISSNYFIQCYKVILLLRTNLIEIEEVKLSLILLLVNSISNGLNASIILCLL